MIRLGPGRRRCKCLPSQKRPRCVGNHDLHMSSWEQGRTKDALNMEEALDVNPPKPPIELKKFKDVSLSFKTNLQS
ncbi:hypothetical protein U1Q18_046354 [Sarracenia purpurea var. burkii]